MYACERANVVDVLPSLSVVVRDGDSGLMIVAAEGEIDAPGSGGLVAAAYGDRRVAAA